MPRALRPLLLAAVLALLAGCTRAEETWTFDRKGGGEYALTVRWDPDLWRRVRGVLGARVMDRLAANGFPLRAALWRDGLQDREGITILELGERDVEGGQREIHLRARFERLEQMLAWDVLAGRTVRLAVPTKEAGGTPRATLYMEPIPRVPVLDRIADLVEAVEKPPQAAEGAAAARDPPPLERAGIDRAAGAMVWKMVKQPLAAVGLRVRIVTPGDVVSVRGRPAGERTRQADFGWTFADLRRVDADRTVRVRWRPLAFDERPGVDRRGRRDPRPRAPDGSRK